MPISLALASLNSEKNGNRQKIIHKYKLSHGLFGMMVNHFFITMFTNFLVFAFSITKKPLH